MTEHVERIVLDERGTARIVELDDDHAALIRASGLLQVEPAGPLRWRLAPHQRVDRIRVGAVRVGELDVEVRPRIGIARLLFLLGYATDPVFRPADTAADIAGGLWPALAETLVRHTERAFAHGPLPGYRTVRELSTVVRGRLLVTEQINRRPGLVTPVEVEYEDMTLDTPEHRILRTALHRIAQLPRLPGPLLDRLHALDARLRTVTLLRIGTPVPAWRTDRRTAGYTSALRLAEIVLRHQSFEYGPGSLTAGSFVVPIARLFEQFVTVAVREALLPHQGTTAAQVHSYLDTGAGVPIRPDIVYTHPDTTVTILDAKYADSGSGRSSDYYQMHAYCTAFQATRGYLVYAGKGAPLSRTVKNTSINLIEYPLDLTTEPEHILERLTALAALVAAGHASAPTAEAHHCGQAASPREGLS